MRTEKSSAYFQRAKQYIPGGVNSPVRAFRSVGMEPLFIDHAEGSRIYDVDGNEYIDYVGSWGPMILGHAHPQVIAAINQAASRGTSYGASHPGETVLAEMICDAFPSIDKIRLVSSGTEAAMSAIRLARAFTGRSKIVKFAGCYHGHADSFLIQAGSGMLTGGVPNSPGVPESLARDTLVCEYNHIDSVQTVFAEMGQDIAAVIVEPMAGNMGLVVPDTEFLKGLRVITEQFGALLIFDEVITGFRVTYGGVQNLLGITPDLTCLGKIIGGGLPVGAYGGRNEIMSMISPEGPVYQAGTLSGNPLAVAAGIATLEILKDEDWYEGLDVKSYILEGGIRSILEEADMQINRFGSMFSIFCTEDLVTDYASVMTSDTEKYKKFFTGMLERGIYLPPSQFEVCFVSCAHSVEDIQATGQAIKDVLDGLY